MSSLGQTSITIRTATPRDMPAIVGIYNWAVNQTFATIDSEPLSAEEAAAWWDEHGSRRLTLVAEDDGVVGWAQLMPWRQRGYEVVEDLVADVPAGGGHDDHGNLLYPCYISDYTFAIP